MRARCIKLVEAASGRDVTESLWVTKGALYSVLAVSVLAEGIRFRLLADDKCTPVILPGEQFEVVDGSIPNGWTLEIGPQGVELGPSVWCEAGFWERFFDGEREAVAAFWEVVHAGS